MVSFEKRDVIAACGQYGTGLEVATGLSGAAVMQAIAANESSVGANCGPRQEPAYSQGGALATAGSIQAELLEYYGAPAASSHGPWQMMFINFLPAVRARIAAGTATLDDYAQEFVRWFNAYVIGIRKAQTLDQIGEVWNLGHVGPDPAYTEKLEAAYQAALNSIDAAAISASQGTGAPSGGPAA